MERRYASGVLLLFATAFSASADSVDDFVRNEMKKQNIPGLSIAVVRNGEVIKAEGYGFANLEHQVPATKDTVYQSGSVGKQFTAAAVMLLVEDGKIGLDDPIGKYIEESPESWKGITIRNLLTHTSGIKDITNSLNLRKDYSESDIVKLAAERPLDFPPGEQWRYSNTAYALLGVVIHKASGKFYGDVLKERVFDPLSMTTARINNEPDIIPNRAAGYRLVGKDIKNQQYVSPTLNTTADGSLLFTVLDMAKWDAGLYTDKVLKKSSLEQSWTPVKLKNGRTHPYGFGWAISDQRGCKEIQHGGAWQGFQTHISRFVDPQLTVIVLANRVGSNPTAIARGIAGFYEPALKPLSSLAASADPDPKLTESLLELVKSVADNKTDAALFTEQHRAELAALSAAEKTRVARPLQNVKSLDFIAADDLSTRNVERSGSKVSRMVHYKANDGARPMYLSFYLTADVKVAGVKAASE